MSQAANLAPDHDAVAARPYSPLPLPAPAYRPPPLEPQLAWPDAAEVDWQRWHAAAAVAILPSAHLASSPVSLNPESGPCGRYGRSSLPDDGDGFILQVNNVAIGQVPSRQAAEAVAGQILEAVPKLEGNPEALLPKLSNQESGGQLDGQTVFVLPDLVDTDQSPAPLEATQWVNNLRLAFGAPPLDSSQVQMVSYGLGETHQTFGGTASWYGPYFHGRQTATGETFDQHDLTAAHKTLPFGTYLKVRNQLNGKTVVVRINDRGPYIGERSLDLSYAAAQCLGAEQPGVIPYQATILAPGLPSAWREEVVAAQP
jgi:hypothetical protein